jgi:uncharacterized membrane protein YkvA (DUF1232 family)
MGDVREAVVGVGVGLVVAWLLLVAWLLVARPRGGALGESVRLLPDLLRLLKDLATDGSQPRGVRWRLAGLAAYLALPFDLVPDFIPVIGYADDVVVVLWTLRSVVRHVGVEEVRRHWRGTEAGFAAVCRLAGL